MRAVAAANPRTVVVVNTGSPVKPAVARGRRRGAARLVPRRRAARPSPMSSSAPRSPAAGADHLGDLAAAPVTRVTGQGELPYEEGVFIGYRAWDRAGATPVYPFGHGLGYTDWTYESLALDGTTATVRVRNTGDRAGREVVQLATSPRP
ncbi:Glycosyl hydrolase OS=Streptomyces alboniger OX=132473 GN=CP975_10745 PE=3 SV=1 [Streptomyces alboniger]